MYQKQKSALLLSLLFFVFGLLCLSLAEISGSSEAREAHVISVIVQAYPDNLASIILPLRNGLVASKPPLFHWIGAFVSFLCGGVTPFLARLPSLFFGSALLFLTLRFSRNFFHLSDRSALGRPDSVVLATALVLTSLYGFTSMATLSMVDMTYAFFVGGAVFTLLDSLRYHPRGEAIFAEGQSQRVPVPPSAMNLFFVYCALAALTKGPIGLALPGILGFAALSYLFSWRTAFATFFTPCIGWILFFLIVTPWYVFATCLGSSSFVERQFIFENLKRVVGGENINAEPWWFYFPAFLKFAAPWSLFTLATLWLDFEGGGFFKKRTLRKALVVIIFTGLLLFSVFAGKRHSYLLPLYPFLALYVTWSFRDLLTRLVPALWFARSKLAATFGGLIFVGLLIFAALPELIEFVPFSKSAELHLLLGQLRNIAPTSRLIAILAMLAIAFELLWCSHRAYSFAFRNSLIAYTASVAFLFLVVMNIFSSKAFFKSHLEIAAAVKALVGTAPVYVVRDVFDETFDPFAFYFDRPVTLVKPSEIESVPDGSFVLSRKDVFDAIPGIVVRDIPNRTQRLKPNDGKTIVLFRKGSEGKLPKEIEKS